MTNPLTPPARFIDPRGQRLGAGLSAAILLLAFTAGLTWPAALIGANLLAAAAFGTRFFLPGRAWPLVRRALRLGTTEPEHEYPPRFAQALGGICLSLAGVAFVVAQPVAGWALVGAVVALQALLAATGYCLGCKLYFLRWWVPSLFARLFGRNDRLLDLPIRGPLPRAR